MRIRIVTVAKRSLAPLLRRDRFARSEFGANPQNSNTTLDFAQKVSQLDNERAHAAKREPRDTRSARIFWCLFHSSGNECAVRHHEAILRALDPYDR